MNEDEQDTRAIQPATLTVDSRITRGSERMTTHDIIEHLHIVQDVLRSAMKPDVHYGVIPGTGGKPSLLKPGAEMLGLLFRLRPEFAITRHDLGNGHREYDVRCTLYHINTGQSCGEGVASCSTMESRYRYRQGERTCPSCGEKTIIKGKEEFGGGWLCYAKKGGCGAKWDDGAVEIEGQKVGRIPNPDIADVYNTCLKIAKKRAHVDAMLTATSASDTFTQDIEDLQDYLVDSIPKTAAKQQQAHPAPAPAKQQQEEPRAQKPAAQPAPTKPQSPPATRRFVTAINAVTHSSGKKADGSPWTRHVVATAVGKFATFSNDIGSTAEANVNKQAAFTVVKDGSSEKIAKLEIVEQQTEQQDNIDMQDDPTF